MPTFGGALRTTHMGDSGDAPEAGVARAAATAAPPSNNQRIVPRTADKNTHVSPDVKGQPAESLPRGRHNLPTHVVRDSQRRRLLAAMLDCVGENGYEATTVPAVVARARVSRNAFYALFDDKTDCFLAVCDDLAKEVLGDMFVTG